MLLRLGHSYMINLEDITLQAVQDVGMDFWWCVPYIKRVLQRPASPTALTTRPCVLGVPQD